MIFKYSRDEFKSLLKETIREILEEGRIESSNNATPINVQEAAALLNIAVNTLYEKTSERSYLITNVEIISHTTGNLLRILRTKSCTCNTQYTWSKVEVQRNCRVYSTVSLPVVNSIIVSGEPKYDTLRFLKSNRILPVLRSSVNAP